MPWLKRANDPIKKAYMFHDIPIDIEWPQGSTRVYKNTDYKKLMHCDYGYVARTESDADGEEIDTYIGPDKDSIKVYKITQLKKDTGEYDEDKFMLGFNSSKEAQEMYLRHMEPEHFGGIEELSWDTFQDMVTKARP